MTPACAAVWNTTKPNSPPCASRMMNTGRSSCGIGISRAMPHSAAALMARKASTTAAISSGCASTTAKSMLMPTAMKKRPSSRPLNGSMSVSSSRRYSLSASSTPARNAPSAIDRPTVFISAAVATTSSSEAAVKISGVSLLAIQRSAGRSSRRPPKMITAIVPIAFAAPSQPPPSLPPIGARARNGIRARIGIAAMSCSSETLRMLSPEVVASTLRSASTPRPIAVDDIARPMAATVARRQSTPARHRAEREQQRRAEQLRAAPAEDGLAERPEPLRLELEADQEEHQDDAELGELEHVLRAGDELQSPRADQDAGAQVADDRAEAEEPGHRHRQHGGGEIDEAAGEPGAVRHQAGSIAPAVSRRSVGRALGGTAHSTQSSTNSISGQSG